MATDEKPAVEAFGTTFVTAPKSSAATGAAIATAAPGATELVRLVSRDGFEFVLDRRCAMVSGTLRTLLSSPNRFADVQANVIELRSIRGAVLELVCQYLHYNVRYTNSVVPVPDFGIDPEMALELLMAADYLDC